ncbi:hypothetical protein ACJX0J_027547, partial [Zea mays]
NDIVITRLSFILLFIFVLAGLMLNFYYLHGREKASLPGFKVTAILEDGRIFEVDLLVGADGIWSKVRKTLFGHSDATYSGYTCYTGIADFVLPDIDTKTTVDFKPYIGPIYNAILGRLANHDQDQ